MPTDAQVERLLTKAEPSSKSRTGEYALAHGRARYVLAGKSGSGKSRAWAAFCCGPIGTKTWDQIIYCAPTRALQGDPKLSVYRTVWKKYFIPIACDDGKIDIETLDAHLAHAKRQSWTCLVTFDDLLAAQRNPRVTDLFVSGRHSSIDTATLCQTLKTGNRTARINASVFWCFNMSEKRCFAELADLLTTEKSRARLLTKAYENITTRDRHGSIIICLDVPSSEKMPFRVRDSTPDCLIPELWRL